jgi:RND family efflux transporter MFP subunit
MVVSQRSILRVSLLVAVASASVAGAQMGGGPAPVKYTDARTGSIRPTLELTGTVESRRTSVVASEVSGKVISREAREGDRVAAGAPLVRLRRENLQLSLDAAKAELEEAEARLELAEANLKRARELYAEEVVSRQILDNAVSEREAWKARVEQLRADMRRLDDDLERSTVRAPFAGVVVEERTAEGEWVSPGSPVAVLMDVGELEVTIQVPERQFAGVQVGSPVSVVIQALGDQSVRGAVRAVVPRADPRARTFPVKVRIPNEEGKVGVGMLATVRLPVGEPSQAVLVPKDALVDGAQGSSVYVIGDDQTVRSVAVRTGSAEGVWIAVEGEVRPGDRVVTRGNERLRPGMPVQGEPLEYPES